MVLKKLEISDDGNLNLEGIAVEAPVRVGKPRTVVFRTMKKTIPDGFIEEFQKNKKDIPKEANAYLVIGFDKEGEYPNRQNVRVQLYRIMED